MVRFAHAAMSSAAETNISIDVIKTLAPFIKAPVPNFRAPTQPKREHLLFAIEAADADVCVIKIRIEQFGFDE